MNTIIVSKKIKAVLFKLIYLPFFSKDSETWCVSFPPSISLDRFEKRQWCFSFNFCIGEILLTLGWRENNETL